MTEERFAVLAAADPDRFLFRLRTIWLVEADASYRIGRKDPRDETILILTRSGAGEVGLNSGVTVRLYPDTLAAFQLQETAWYGTRDEIWNFTWFSGFSSGPVPYRCNEAYPVAAVRFPVEELLALLDSPDVFRHRQASAQLTAWIHDWTGETDHGIQKTANAAAYLCSHAGSRFPLTQLARKCALSPRQFRRCFLAEQGITPQKYHTRIRMNYALELLQKRLLTLKEIAAQLGYSGAFHFSAAFKRHYGVSPTGWLRRHAGNDGSGTTAP